MVTRSATPETGETVCPACGAGIRTSPSARRRRVQCPKCREVVFIESALGGEAESAPLPTPAVEMTAETRSRLESLEARVEALEAALRETAPPVSAVPAEVAQVAILPVPPVPPVPVIVPQRKLVWVSATPGRAPAFSPEQGDALFHNLHGVPSQPITIRTPAGDPATRTHAEWFKSIFERAGWTVLGPDEVPANTTGSGLSLAVPELPVGKEAAAVYLALKAAGFEAEPMLDRAPRNPSGEKTAIALTLAPVKPA